MIALEDRRIVAHNINIAHADGARLRLACEIAGIDLRTLQRWQAHAGPPRQNSCRPNRTQQ